MSLSNTQLKCLVWKNYLSIKKDKRNIFSYIIASLALILIQTLMGIGILNASEDISISYNRTETSSLKNLFQNSLNNLIPSNELYLGFIYPNNNNENEQLTNIVMQNEIFSLSKVKPKIFENEKSLEEFYENQSNNLLAGIVFQSNLTSYTIRMDHSYVTSPSLDSVYSISELKNNETDSDIYLKYFVPIQNAIDQAIIQHKTNSSIQINSNVGGLAIPKVYNGNNELSIFIIMFFLLLFIYYIMMPLPIYICDEKQHQIKKILSINGVSSSLYYLSWILLYFIMIIVPLIVCTLIEVIVGVYSPANVILKFLSFLLFVVGVLFLFTFTSVLFTDPKNLNEIISTMGIILMFVPYAFKYISDGIIIFDYIFVCLPSGRIIGKVYENTVMGITTFKDVFGDFYILNCFVCIIVGILLFFILTIVLDSVVNEEAEPFFRGLFNKKSKGNSDSEKSSEVYKEDIEAFHTNDKCFADISNIVKKFKYSKKQQKNNGKTNEDFVEGSEFCALNHVSFKVYENEIFGILGHNGAGKSTLLNIMTGLINPNEGQVYYDGEDFINNKDKIRKLFGVCPQECGLFEKLSVEQNLLIFAGLKEVQINVDDILSEVDLLDKKKSSVNILSGGQKKKLSIAIALMGNPKYVFLDEPTTGLDPLSRRNIWDLLKKNKNGKVIFLSTHYMDEADILTDRKLILHKGVIRCLGSSMYLKKHFNMMYNLKVETENYNEACSIIQKRIPESIPVIENDSDNDSDHVYTFKIPMNSVSKISGLIDELEEYSKQHGIIKNFSISLPSLEELFVRLELYKNKNDNNSKEKNDAVTNENDVNTNTDTFILIDKKVNLPHCENLNKLSNSQKISILLKLRYKLYLKSKSFIFNTILIPIILFIGIVLFSKISTSNKKIDYEPLNLSYDKLYSKTLWNYDTQQSNMDPEIFKTVFGQANMSNFDTQVLDGIGANFTSKNDYSFSMNSNNNGTYYNIDVYYNKTMTHSPPSIFNGISNAILKSQKIDDKITVYSDPFSYFDITNYTSVLLYMIYFIGIILTLCLSTFGLMIMKEKVKGLKKQLYLNQVDSKNYYLSNLIIDFSIYGFISIMIIIIGLIFQYEPFLNIYSIISFLLIAIVSSLASLLFQYTLSLFFKKEHIAYATFTMIHLIMILIGIAVVYIQNISNFDTTYILSDGAVYASTISTIIYPPIALVIAFYLSIQMNMYHITHNLELTSDHYLKKRNGFVPVLLSSLISCLVYYYLLAYLDKKLNNNKEAESKLKENSAIVEQNEAILRENEDLYHEMKLIKSEKESMPLSILHLVKEFIVEPRTSEEKHKIKYSKTYQYGELHRSKYITEKIVKTVIEDVSFGIREKECFGLLGPNGVGKSTLLNTITSNINQTYGKIYFNGVESNQYDGIIGYCPQEDVLWDELSPLDHVMFYLRLRGLPKNMTEDYAHQYIKYCQIEEHMNKPVSKLSGGTKRKLCILLAVCGSPKQIILDEPTSGIDPATRLFIWNMIKEMKEREKSSMILTTHSMEEAQELCDRLTILINGRLVCIGSPEYLRMKYANSYILEVQTEQQETVHEMIFGNNSYFNSCTYKKEKITNDRFKYQIELNEGLGKLFDIMENAKNNGTIKDYTISQSNLEQVFIDFAKQFIQ